MRSLRKSGSVNTRGNVERTVNSTLPIVAVDFDGTIVLNNYPYIENPNNELIDFIKRNRDKYVWVLWTCRKDNQLQMAIDYMANEHGIVFDFVNQNTPWNIEKYGDTRKVFAPKKTQNHIGLRLNQFHIFLTSISYHKNLVRSC